MAPPPRAKNHRVRQLSGLEPFKGCDNFAADCTPGAGRLPLGNRIASLEGGHNIADDGRGLVMTAIRRGENGAG